MKIIGMIGGMSWESSLEYYRLINETVRERLGGLHSAKSIMYSVDFAEIEALQHAGKWDQATALMIEAARHVEKGGADFVIICTNTMHKMADAVEQSISIPLLHIADAAAQKIVHAGMKKVGLLGTKFTMEEDFYRTRLIERYGLDVIIPDEISRQDVHQIIYDELCLGRIEPASRKRYQAIIDELESEGAQGIILGCTEIGLLINEKDCSLPLFDTTAIHAVAAVEYAIGL